jgi:uncharacterized protein YnzC (UPF0291/DUF896 family)
MTTLLNLVSSTSLFIKTPFELFINSIYQALGFKGTPMQLERYNDKYKRAKDGKFSPDENASIITKHDEYISEVRKSVDMIEFFRSSVEKLLDSRDFDKSESLINVVRLLIPQALRIVYAKDKLPVSFASPLCIAY